MARDRGVNPECPNASNPFHICAEYCPHGAPKSMIVKNLNGVGGKEIGAKMQVRAAAPNGVGSKDNGEKIEGRGRAVDPLCVNASNPFHECANYCTRRSPDGKISPKGAKLVNAGGSRRGSIVVERKDVDPRCVNASNPFHRCAEYCSQKIKGEA
ncbi:hypothetical protein AXF42_Ash007080 [Apostasia shenzhenica]|uniref:Uncharacterized protein n=1 Tax=Apostasia shenzhenica TaxID=1088818 RepID=A0A2I0BF04_9ASPA|nr:hypothetical protein AXF42_Ash007080 [Apostasia shenzhenica]